MDDGRLKQVDVGRYMQLLRLTVESECALALCDTDGRVVWSSDTGVEIVERLEGLALHDFALEGCEASSQPCEDGSTLIYAALQSEEDPLGWLACRIPPPEAGAADPSLDRCRAVVGELARCVAQDISVGSETTGLVDELAERCEELNLVYSFARETPEADSGLGAIQRVLEEFAESLEVDVVAFILPETRSITCATNLVEPVSDLELTMVQLRTNVYHFVEAQQRTVVINDREDKRRDYLLCGAQFRLLAHPVLINGSVQGLLALLRHPDRPAFSNGDRNLAGAVVRQATILLRNHSSVEHLRRFSAQMASALIAAVEAKDPYTRGHSERVQAICLELGREIGLPPEELQDLHWGALLHDVGKLAVPDFILAKDEPLTDDEFTFVKMHPKRGYEILREIESLGEAALDAVRCHHERWDGTGYPNRLAGDRIPLCARIVAVADTYDAITGLGSYRKPQDHETALERIHEAAGAQLDPEIVAVFERIETREPGWLERIASRRER